MRTNLINTIRSLSVSSMLLAAACGLATVFAGAEAKAWIIDLGPNSAGGNTTLDTGRLNPLANIPVPGTKKSTMNGEVWIGLDGQVHGNEFDPSTGNMHFYAPKPATTNNRMTAPIQRPMPIGRPAGTNVYPAGGSVNPVYNVRPNVGNDPYPTFRPTPQYLRTR